MSKKINKSSSSSGRINGGVYIANRNGLRGDIIPIEHHHQHQQQHSTSSAGGYNTTPDHSNSSWGTDKQYVVRLRGSEIEIPVDKSELIPVTATATTSNKSTTSITTTRNQPSSTTSKTTSTLSAAETTTTASSSSLLSPEEIKEQQHAMKEEEDIRFYLNQMADEYPDEIYIEDRVITMELGDEFTYMLVSNSPITTAPIINNDQEEESPSSSKKKLLMNKNKLLPDIEGSIFVRLLEGYFVGHGIVVTNGRHLDTYKRALFPFYREQQQQQQQTPNNNKNSEEFTCLPGKTCQEIFDQLNEIFDNNNNTDDEILIFRAFAYAHHRLDYHHSNEQTDGNDNDNGKNDNDNDNIVLLDAYCVVFYVLKLLQGTIIPGNNNNTTDYTTVVNQKLDEYGSGVQMAIDDLVWCFCILFLRIGTDIRRYKIKTSPLNDDYNRIFPKPFDLAMNEELFVCQLAIECRPDSPVSFLPAYRMVMETKTLVPKPFQVDWLKTAYDFAERGVEAADRWGDPYFTYMFEMILTYWIPTTIMEPNPYTLGQIEDQINFANGFKKECSKIVPKYMFRVGEAHELSLRKMLRAHSIINKETELTVALVDAFTYEPLHLKRKPRQPPEQPPEPPQSPLSRYLALVKPKPGSDPTTTTTNTSQICAHCLNPIDRRFKCSHCKKSQFCSRECQVDHWQRCHQETQCVPSSPRSSRKGECGYCSMTLQKALMCSKCKQIGYCDRDCQIKHWKAGHKHACQKG